MIKKFIVLIIGFLLFYTANAEERSHSLPTATALNSLANRLTTVMRYLPGIPEDKKLSFYQSSNKQSVSAQLCEVVEKKISDKFKAQFLLQKPNKTTLMNDVRDYACLTNLPRVRAGIILLDSLISTQYARSLWLLRHILEQALSERVVVSSDYLSFGSVLLNEATRQIYRGESYHDIWDEVYLMNKKAVELNVGLSESELTDAYAILLKYTSDNQLHAEHIRYNLLFQRLNDQHQSWKATNVVNELFLAEHSHTLAQSYFYCGRIKEAIEQYKKILGNKDIFDNPRYKKFVKSIKLGDLVVLYSLYLAITDENDKKVIWEIFHATTEHMDPEAIQEINRKFSEVSPTSSSRESRATNSKKKDKSVKQQMSKVESLRVIVMRQFIADRQLKMKEMVKFVRELNIFKDEKDQETYGVNPQYLSQVKTNITNIESIFVESEKLNAQGTDFTLQVRLCHERMKASFEELKEVSKQFREALRRKVRESYQPNKPGYVLYSPLSYNQKSDVSSEPEQLKKKEKTRGEEDLAEKQQADKQEQGKENSEIISDINNIISCQSDILDILTTRNSGTYPPNTVELLSILRGSENIFELRNNLRGYNAQLKKFEETGQWSFRVNDTYRVRFYVNSSHHFTNVEIGNFH